MRTPAVLRALWLAGGFALLLALGRDAFFRLPPTPRELPRFDGATGKAWVDDPFVPAQAVQEIAPGVLPPHLHRVTSWVGTDEWQGRAETAWFKASRWLIHVGVAGYPRHRGCALWAEFRRADDTMVRVDCPLPDPREEWSVWEIRRPGGAVAVRLVAEDRASDNAGWVAFSHPYRDWPGAVRAAYQLLQVFTTLALALTLLWAPGLWWPRRVVAPEFRAVVYLGAGPLLLAALGIVLWILGLWIRPQTAGLVLVTALWAAIGWRAWRAHFALPESGLLPRVLAGTALITAAVVAKSFHAVGPEGELFRGTVSRNFEMADRIDSRFSFYVAMAAAHRLGPAAPETEGLFFPWTFFSRGPLAGLTAIPIILATGGEPPIKVPEARWSPYDPTGFAAFRITQIALAAMVVGAVFLVFAPLLGPGWAALAAGLVALSPFGVHEMMFTWPKWAATAWLVAAFGLAHARRPLAAGLALGVGFLFHPLVLLWGPWLALWQAGRRPRRVMDLGRVLALFGLGALALVGPWMALGAWMPHLPTTPLAGQGGFFRYFARADWQLPTWDTWWHTRWMNFANTFLPLHGYLADASFQHPKLSSAYEASGRLVKFSQLWWNSLPFALGLGLWATGVATSIRTARSLPAASLLFVAGPALLLTAYWGMDPLGLMRECGHPLLVTCIVLACTLAARQGGWLARMLRHPAVPWLQLPETWLMLWLTTLLNPRPWAANFSQLDPLYLILNALCLGAAAWSWSRLRRDPAPFELPATLSAGTIPAPVPATRSWLWQLAESPPRWLVLALGAILIALRRPDQIRHPQLWAEDGIFFFQAHEIGARAFLLDVASYLQLAPRVIAAASLFVDPAWVPHVFVGAVLALTLYVMSRALSARCPLPWRGAAALCIVLVPDAAEVMLNANNIQWVLAGGAVLLLISDDPTRPRQWLHDVAAAVGFGLTGPFSILLAPLFAARAWVRKSRASVLLAVLVAACALIQGAMIVLHPQPGPAGASFDPAALLAFPGLRLTAVLLFGAAGPATLPVPFAIGLTALLGALLAFLALRPGDNRPIRLALAAAFAALLASTLFRTWHSMPLLSEPGAASRYIYPLQLLLLWLLLALTRDRSTAVRLLCGSAALWLVVANAPRLRIPPVPDKHWETYAPRLRAGEAVTIPINPDGWEFSFPARPR